MGTDVITIVETKEDNGWLEREEFHLIRNYPAFAILADVRSSYLGLEDGILDLPIIPLRGLPNDSLSDLYYFGDLNNRSWLTLKEVEYLNSDKIYNKLRLGGVEENIITYIKDFYSDLISILKDYREHYNKEVRIVFGFDC